VLAEIMEEMTTEQLQAIAAMQITRTEMQVLAKEWGISTGMPPGGGQNLSDDERATRRAQNISQGQFGMGIVLMERVIELLTERGSGTAMNNQNAPSPQPPSP
jgi:hypothetical protein